MISCYFGVPGCGKSTLLTKLVRDNLKKSKNPINRLFKRYYDHIYSINICIDGAIPITWDDLKKYRFENSLLVIDEITMLADNREFKTFPKDIRDFFILHRHMGLDIIYATQNYEKVDKVIRDLTHDLWYMSKSIVPFLSGFTSCKKIYRKININEFTSDLTLGYRFCTFIESIFASNFKLIWRSKYYRYFNSFDLMSMSERPLIDKTKVYYINKKGELKWKFLKKWL